MIREAYVSLQCLLVGFGVVSYFLFGCSGFHSLIENWAIEISIYVVSFFIGINIPLYLLFRGSLWQVAIRSSFIGTVMGIGVIVSVLTSSAYKPFGYYLIVLSLFHFSEYFSTAALNPTTVSLDSFLLNHSVSYWVAAAASWTEFFLEVWFLPQWKDFWYISVVGVLFCLAGEVVRKLAMWTAGKNFNHIVQDQKQPGHQLVTSGVYNFCRHPSYVGWFWWSLGTQIILVNPVCLLGYAVASWIFFSTRIWYEEMTLIRFFGKPYLDYKNRVGTGLPFIYGYVIDKNRRNNHS